MSLLLALTSATGSTKDGAASLSVACQFSAAAGAIRSGSAALAIASTFSSSANATRSASAAITFSTTWTASAEAIVPGTTKDGAATLAVVSNWTASATLRTTSTSSGGGYGTARRSRVLPVTPILYIKPAAAKCHIATRWTAAPRTLRAASAGITSKVTLHGTACKRAQGSGTTRNRTSATARAHVLRGIGMSDTEALQLLELFA